MLNVASRSCHENQETAETRRDEPSQLKFCPSAYQGFKTEKGLNPWAEVELLDAIIKLIKCIKPLSLVANRIQPGRIVVLMVGWKTGEQLVIE